MTGKKLGIIALICSILFTIFAFINVSQEPEYPDEIWDLMTTDMEQAIEMEEEILENASTLYKVSDMAMTVFGLGAIILAIIALVKMAKGNEKGKIIAILAIVFVIVFFFVAMFSSDNMKEGIQAGLEASMEMTEE